jgi:O-antigen ligase
MQTRKAGSALWAVVLAGACVGAARGHLLVAVALGLALVVAWRRFGFGAVAAVCVGTIALGSSSVRQLAAAGHDERWVALFTLALWPAVTGRRPGLGANRRVVGAACGLLLLAAVSVLWSVDTHLTIGRVGAFAVLLWVALVVFPLHARTPQERLALARSLAVLCVTGSVLALILGVTDPGVARVGGEAAVDSAQQGLPRAYGALQGWLENSNTLGLWCVLLAPCLLVVRPRRAAVLATLPVLAAILLSQSRAALLVGILLVLAVLPVSPLRKVALTLGAGAIVAAVLLSPAHSLLDRTALRKFQDTGSKTRILTGAREEAWDAAFQIVPAAPVQGFGFGAGESVFEQAGSVQYFRYFVGSDPSNAYLLMLLELGVIGLLFLLALLAIAVREAWPARVVPTRRPFFLMAVGVLITGMVESIFTSPGSPFTILLWSGVGVAAARGVSAATESQVVAQGRGWPAPRMPPIARRLGGGMLRWPRTAHGTLILSATIGLGAAGLAVVPGVNARLLDAVPSEYEVALGRLTGDASGPGVPFGVPSQLEGLRVAAARLPSGARYYAYSDAGEARAALGYAARLYIPNGLPMRLPSDADWIVSYRAPALVPAGVIAKRAYAVAPDVFLVQVR